MTLRTQMLGMAAATAMLMASAAPAQAFTQELVDAKLHVLQCFGLLFTDPARHLAECGVGDMSTQQSLNFHITGVIPIICPMYYELYEGKCYAYGE